MNYKITHEIELPELGMVQAVETTAPENSKTRTFMIPGLTIIPEGNTWRGAQVTVHGPNMEGDWAVCGNAYHRNDAGEVNFTEYHVSLIRVE